MLSKLGANCTRLSLEYDRISEDFLSFFIESFPQLVSRLTHLRLQVCKLVYLPIIADHFTNLEHLDLSVKGLEYFKFSANLMESLSKLPKLSELRLSPVLHSKSENSKFDFFVQPLLSVKSVFLSLQTRLIRVKINFDYDFLFEMLRLVCPKLEMLELYNNNETIPDLGDKLKQFERLQICYLNQANYRFL